MLQKKNWFFSMICTTVFVLLCSAYLICGVFIRSDTDDDRSVKANGNQSELITLEDSEREAKDKSEVKERENDLRVEKPVQAIATRNDRQLLAEKLFSEISLQTTELIHLSRTLKEMHDAKVELRGKEIETIALLHRAKDWLGLVNKLSQKSFTELPDAEAIESAVRKLREFNVFVLLRTKSVFEEDSWTGLRMFRFELEGCNSIVTTSAFTHENPSGKWHPHPDGIGYYMDWHPSYGHTILVLEKNGEVWDYQEQVNKRYARKISELAARENLGEIDSTTAKNELANFRKLLIDDAKAWAIAR